MGDRGPQIRFQTNHTGALGSDGMNDNRLLIPLLGAMNPYPRLLLYNKDFFKKEK